MSSVMKEIHCLPRVLLTNANTSGFLFTLFIHPEGNNKNYVVHDLVLIGLYSITSTFCDFYTLYFPEL